MKKNTTQQTANLFDAIQSAIPEMTGLDLDALRADIKQNGQLVPILVKGKKVIDGRARLKVCQELGIKPIVHDLGDAANDATWAYSTNVVRRDLTPGQKAFIAEAMATRSKGSNQHSADAGCSQEVAAKLMGVSSDSIRRVRIVKKEGCHSLVNMVAKGELTPNAAVDFVKQFPSPADQEEVIKKGMNQMKKEKYKKEVLDVKRAKAQQLAKSNGAALETLKGVYSVIYADPPWNYGGNNTGSYCDPSVHYPLMSTEEIKALPVKNCLDKDAALYLWVPSCLIPDGLEVMKAWGFEYSSSMVWCKKNAVMSGGPTKTAHEMLLIGRKGKALHDNKKRIKSWVQAPTTAHSKKPEIFAKTLEEMYPGFPKLEMFARQPRSNEWSIFGNQVVNASLTTQTTARSKIAKAVKQVSNKTARMSHFAAANDSKSQRAA